MRQPIINEEACAYLRAKDDIFSRIEDRYGLPPNWQRPPGFETLARLILEQQVRLESAYNTYRLLVEKLGALEPERILTLDDREMRACKVSRQKARYLRILSEAVLNRELDIPGLAELPENEVRARLTTLTGIGPWTADIYLLTVLQAPDLFPLGDVAAVNSVKHLKGVATKEEVGEIAANWSPYRSTALYYCWHDYLGRQGRNIDAIYG